MQKSLYEIILADDEHWFKCQIAADDFDAALKEARSRLVYKNCKYIIKVEQTATIEVI